MKKHIVDFVKYLLLFLLILSGCAGIEKKAPKNWADDLLKSMTLEKKIGQMLAVAYTPKFYPDDDPEFMDVLDDVSTGKVGGIMIFEGELYAVARTIDKLQSQTAIPLLVMADIEWGISMRIREGTTFPPNMAIGATGSEEFAYQMGKISALEARAMGLHIGFVPVLDVNNNPKNIIINTRSYGEDPQLVARLGSAYIKGFQSEGLYATAKHFPGHGDTQIDSHLDLPTISVPPQRVREVELLPFQAAIEAGVKAVMIAHITYSGFPEMRGLPSTLDPYFVQQILKKEMGFNGLVISDAMDMGGINKHFWSGDAAVRAINSGIDFILLPPNFDKTYQFILQAVKDGRISVNRIDQAVKKILNAKSELGLWKKQVIDLNHVEAIVNQQAHRQQARQMADASVTLVRDQNEIFPLHADQMDSILVVTITDGIFGYDYQQRLLDEITLRVPVAKSILIDAQSKKDQIINVINQSRTMDAVVVGMFVRWASYKGSITLPDSTIALIQQLFQIPQTLAVISFGSPYIIKQIYTVPSFLCVYDTTPLAVGAAVRALFGEIPIKGHLPVSLTEKYTFGWGINKPIYPMAIEPEIDNERFKEALNILEQGILDSVFPGAQVAVVHRNKLICSQGIGHLTYELNSPEVNAGSIYDLSSLTKVVATTTIAMRLSEGEKIGLDIPVNSYLPEFSGANKDSVTIKHLLTHSSGLPSWEPLWEYASDRSEALSYICDLPLIYHPGDSMVYSDLGIILLGEIIQNVTGQQLDRFVRDSIAGPLGLKTLNYMPEDSLTGSIAPSEIGGELNRGLIQGSVHDDNTYFLGGISSHAGLFSNAEDLAVFSVMCLNEGIYKHHRFFHPATVKEWTTRQNLPAGSERALGWDTPSDNESSAGDYFSAQSYGHLGFTGTSLWIDPVREIAIILLTNRTFPTRYNEGIFKVRRDFHNAVMKEILKN
jgi:beta-glucosidase-like glycosyl hydrolase/CubicO group peptidase (beta-lactamase class C family)